MQHIANEIKIRSLHWLFLKEVMRHELQPLLQILGHFNQLVYGWGMLIFRNLRTTRNNLDEEELVSSKPINCALMSPGNETNLVTFHDLKLVQSTRTIDHLLRIILQQVLSLFWIDYFLQYTISPI